MLQHFISLQWKSFFRSSSVGKSIALKIFLGFFAVYFSISFLGFGILLHDVLLNSFPKKNPFIIVQQYVGIWILFELVLRFFMQTLPVINMKSFLTINVKKHTIIHYVLSKSLLSYYNLISLFVAIPFAIVCYNKKSCSLQESISWVLCIVILTFIINYINFFIKKSFSAHLQKFILLAFLLGIIITLEYFKIFSINYYISKYLLFVVENPFLIVLFVAILFLVYFLNFRYLKNNFYLDSLLKLKNDEAETTNFDWTKRFGAIAPFLQLDLKLIWRNKRPRATVLMSGLFLAYGLLFYTNSAYSNTPAFYVFIGIFTTGIFMINFGQFIPAWDSNYYSLIHSQNISFKNYLASKAGLLTFSVIVLTLLSIPYGYFGWNIFWINLACGVYNIGVNVLVILYSGSFNKKKIDLEKSPFMNYQGTGAAQWIVGIPLMIFPIIIWYICYKITNQNIATTVLALIGIAAIIMRNYFFNKIEIAYKTRKYSAIEGFKQQEN